MEEKIIETIHSKICVTIKSRTDTQVLSARKGLGFQAICANPDSKIEFDCRNADCGICAFKVVAGAEFLSPIGDAEKDFLAAMKADPDERLACQVRAFGDITILVDYL